MSTNEQNITGGFNGRIESGVNFNIEDSKIKKDEYLKGFEFEGITQNGRIKMPIEAPSEKVLREWLEAGHIEVVKIKKKTAAVSGSKKIKDKDIANFVGQLADRKQAGQGDVDAIKSCAEATSNFTLRIALQEIVERMENGESPDKAFSESFVYNVNKKRHSDRRTFPKELISTIKAGKRGAAVLLLKDYERRLTRSIEKRAEVISDLIYPMITIFVSVILSQVMIFVIIPQFEPLYKGILGDKQMQLPFMTRFFVGISNFATSLHGLAIIGSVIAAITYALYWLFKTEKGIKWRQQRELFLPSIGIWKFRINLQAISKLLTAYQGSVHLTSLGQTMKATDLVTALRETAEGSPHVVYAEAFNAIADTMQEHSGGFAPLGRPYAHLLHKDFYSLVETGAQGDMSEQVLKLADQLQEDFQRQLSRLTKLITPATVIILGIILGAVVISMYLPMLDIIGRMASK